MKDKWRNQRGSDCGITIIALIVTIVVIVILGAVTIEVWVDMAIVDEEGETSCYVNVRVNEGYTYYVYYDWVLGKVEVGYLGKEEERKAFAYG